MDSFEGLRLGDQLRCLNGSGWSHFDSGDIYTVTELWVGGICGGIDLDGHPVAEMFVKDFELVEE